MFKNTIINIYKIDNDYQKTLLYKNIESDLQLRVYNIKDVNNITSEDQETNKYYIMVDKKYTLIRPGYMIEYTDDFGEVKQLKITAISMQKFISKIPFIEIKATDYD